MSQVVESEAAADAAEPVLTPKLGPRWALRLWHLAVIAVWGCLFLLISYTPLRPNDLWCHVEWGRWMLSHGHIPTADPFQPLAAGMPVVDSAWLSQVILGAIDQYAGPEWLSNTFALVTLVSWLIIARVLYLRSSSPVACLLMTAVVFLINYSRTFTPRPENFAWLSFAVLAWLLVADCARAAPRFRWQLWFGVPLVMAAWANLHGSFLCGLMVLGALAIGEFVQSAFRSRSLAAAFADPEVRARAIALQLGIVATFINPYGPDLLLSATLFASNANLREVLEWQPLVVGKAGGYEFFAAWALGMVLLRVSRRPIHLGLVLLLAVFGASTLASNRMVGWFALTFGVAFVPLLADALGQWFPSLAAASAAEESEPVRGFSLRQRSWAHSLVALLLIWIVFSMAPVSQPLLGGKPRPRQRLLGPQNPQGLTEYFQNNPPPGQVFNPMWWGDWLIHDGPEGIRPFLTSNIHLVPRLVWRDYLGIVNMRPNWQQALAKYGAETVIVDRKEMSEMERALRRDSNWRVLFQDDLAVVFALRKSSPAQKTSPDTNSATAAK